MSEGEALMEVLRGLSRDELELYAWGGAILLHKFTGDMGMEVDGIQTGNSLGALKEACEDVASTVRARVDQKLSENN